MNSKRVVVIGSGFGGLAIANRLAVRGHDVTIIEKRDRPGGRAYVFERDGFTFDAGPTVITAPWLITEIFELAGRDTRDYVDLVPLDPFYRIFFPDESKFEYSGDPEAMIEEIRRFSMVARDVEGYRELALLTQRIFAKGFTELATQPFLRPWDMVRIAPDLLRLQSYRSVYGLVARYIADERLRQILSFHPLLVGGNPFDTTSIYTLIQHLEREWGVWYALGGTGAVVAALVRLFEESGGKLVCGREVIRIPTRSGKATGVELSDGTALAADIVISNGDVVQTNEVLLEHHGRRSSLLDRTRRLRHSMSLVVIYFGVDRMYRADPSNRLAHHNIILGPRYRELLEDVFTKKILADDFSLYLHMPTLTDPSLAPPGCDALYVLSPVPHLGGNVDWERAARPYRDRIMRFLEERYLPGLADHIVTEHMIDPRYFRDDLNSHLGSAFSVEPILTQSAFFRPHNRSAEIPNLYFVGAGTHPGAGLPGVLSSAKIVDDLID